MVFVKSFCFNPFQENTQIIYSPGGDAVLVDPGNNSAEELKQIEDFLIDQETKPVKIINTHCHIDHVLGVQVIREKYHIPFYIHPLEKEVLAAMKIFAPTYGIMSFDEPAPDQFINEGDTFSIGDATWNILFVPGHSPGHVAFYQAESKKLIAGDIIFRNSIGRTDLPGGDHETLISGIKEKIFSLPDDVEIFSGHGPNTTVGYEKKYNPFLQN
jgi:hydroxyacylglutathione hydrolase